MATGLCARPIPLGGNTSDDESFEKKIDRRILPRTFDVFDDPTEERFGGKVLAGAYTIDDEGVVPQRVRLIENGMLKTLVAGRSPTKKIKQSTGHARAPGFGDPQVTIGCLYLSDSEGLSAEELKKELIDAAIDEGLDFGLRIESLESGYGGFLGNPVYAYKVFVDDGREELIRGIEFLEVQPRALKRLLAAGKEQNAYNATGEGLGRSVITPAILFEELELTRIEEEFDKPPILESPFVRGDPEPRP
jgi:predicted Zn-dependent protease